MVQALLDHGVNVTPQFSSEATALQYAVKGGFVGIAQLLLQRGAEVDAVGIGSEGRTALEGAAENGRIDMLGVLLSAGAQTLGSGSEQFESAKNLAWENGHFAARRFLISIHDSRLLNSPADSN
jgi:ankyrin repeat protein